MWPDRCVCSELIVYKLQVDEPLLEGVFLN